MIRTLMLLLLAALSGMAADWPQFLGAHRDGSSNETNRVTLWPKDGPRIAWRLKIGSGWSGPIVASNRVMMFHRADDREIIECLNATNGARVWRADYPATYRDDFGFEDGPRATPAVAFGKVFTFGADGVLACWNSENGKSVWRIETRQQFSSDKGFFGIACSPLVDGRAVILNLGGRNGAGIVAFDVDSGRVLWKASEQEASYSSPVAADVGGKRRLLVLARSALVALDGEFGKVIWEFPFRPRIQASVTAAVPLVMGDRLFLSASYGAGATLLRFHESKPEVIWSGDDILSNHYATSVHHEGFLYGFDGRQEQRCHLRCVELDTGKIRWSQEHFGGGTLIRVQDRLLILSERGELILAPAKPNSFSVLARAQILGSDCRAHPAFANGFFYARDKQNLVCVDLRGF